MHPREFFGKSLTRENIKTKKREFNLEVLKFKDFYLKIKIANIRKRLTENESLNKELCLDCKTHKDLINVKLMVKALEELAEDEQKRLIEEEREAFEKRQKEIEENKNKLSIPDSEVQTPRSEADDAEAKPKDGAKAAKDKSTGDKDDDHKKATDGGKKDGKKGKEAVDMMKFGNAIRSKNVTHSPLLSDRPFMQLNTIEEEKHET